MNYAFDVVALETNKPIRCVFILLGTNDIKTVFNLSAKEIAEGAGLLHFHWFSNFLLIHFLSGTLVKEIQSTGDAYSFGSSLNIALGIPLPFHCLIHTLILP
jgi:hypothetical protein